MFVKHEGHLYYVTPLLARTDVRVLWTWERLLLRTKLLFMNLWYTI